jgi:cytidylate kinase
MSSGTSLPELVVAIDGPSGSGKSSVSRGVALRLGLRYLDTGAQYRAMTRWMLDQGVDLDDRDAIVAASTKPEIVSGTDPRAPEIRLDDVDVTVAVRSPEVTAAVSAVASVPEVRRRLIALQRQVIGTGGIVVEGRDIAAVVAPDAQVKIYLTASPEVRARRRNADRADGASGTVSVEQTQRELARRDAADALTTRPHDAADGAVVVDATHLTLTQVIDRVAELATAPVGTS